MTPSIGRIVHYQIRDGIYRPAIITQVFTNEDRPYCNLQVFLDGENDTIEDGDNVRGYIAWMTSRYEGDSVGDWRWPPRD